MRPHDHPETPVAPRRGERGAALLIALLVALVLVFLGMGLLLQTSLGLQASGTDRWVVKALYAAEAGAMLQIEMLQSGIVGAIGGFNLVDDPALPGLLKGQFNVQITDLCETQPISPILNPPWEFPKFHERHFHLRSASSRAVGGLGGLAQTGIEVDVSAWPYQQDSFVEIGFCFQ